MFEEKRLISITIASISIWTLVGAAFSEHQIRVFGTTCHASRVDLDVTLRYEVPNTPTGKCLMECMLKLLKFLNKYGLYDRNATLEGLKVHWSEIGTSSLEKLADKCGNQMAALETLAHKDVCEYGYRAANCLHLKYEEEWTDGCDQDLIYVPYHRNTVPTTLSSTTQRP